MYRLQRLLAVATFGSALISLAQTPESQWPTYGGDMGGQRYTASSQITPSNVSQLKQVWTLHTGDTGQFNGERRYVAFEATPLMFHDTLYIGTPYNEIIAVDPGTGRQIWKFDPKIKPLTNVFINRGVAAWPQDSKTRPSNLPCAARIFMATADRRLIAVDAVTGQPCQGFGDKGTVDLSEGIRIVGAEYGFSSPPTVIGDVVVIGSKMSDNIRVDIESGLVRAYSAITGQLLWSWEPLPWAQKQNPRTGAGNTWGVIAADPEHNLVFLPTGAPSNDFFGGTRPGDNRDANSIVALEATTGRRVWGFQVVHHDLWDYDVAAEPLLFTFRGKTPAVAVSTKMGLVFVLNRLTGEPLYPVIEKPVPASDVPGKVASPTQPFQQIDPLGPITIDTSASLGVDARDNKECKALISDLRYEGIYTPPSLKGTLLYPGNIGGVNWGSSAFDPKTGILYANANSYGFSLKFSRRDAPAKASSFFQSLELSRRRVAVLVLGCIIFVLLLSSILRRSLYPGRWAGGLCILILVVGLADIAHIFLYKRSIPKVVEFEHFGPESGPQLGTPYTVYRTALRAKTSGNPCSPQPWAAVSALNLNTGKAVWRTPLGTKVQGARTGTVSLGGDLVTASGLLFTGASQQALLRAFDSATGKELWQGPLPVPAQSTPMSYTYKGRQYVVIAAGGHEFFGTPGGDSLIAFALPQP